MLIRMVSLYLFETYNRILHACKLNFSFSNFVEGGKCQIDKFIEIHRFLILIENSSLKQLIFKDIFAYLVNKII